MSEPIKDTDVNEKVKAAARQFVDDNIVSPTPQDYAAFEAVALIGAAVTVTHIMTQDAKACL